MNPNLAVIATGVSGEEENLNLIGVHRRRMVKSFPASADLTLVLDFNLDEGDWHSERRLTIHLLDKNDNEVARLTSSPINFGGPQGDLRPTYYGPVVIPARVTFDSPGIYRFDIRDNGASWRRIPYIVLLEGSPESQPLKASPQ